MNNESAADDEGIQVLLAELLEAAERGEAIDREQLCREYPQYADSVCEFLDNNGIVQEAMAAFRDGGAERPVDSAFAPTLDSQATSQSTKFEIGDSLKYVGEYEIIDEIARGGMGIVFKARQAALRRDVALKMILAGRLASEADVDRFHREARAAAALKHPNIVGVYEVGQHEGHHYFTMDFIEGESLAHRVSERPLSPRGTAELIKTVANAIEYAHGHGVLHRDLKPANILLDGEGKPHVTDFGLAKTLVDDATNVDLTATGQILGTPSYMAPEQASAKHQLVGVSSDVYSLGAIMYACLSGRAPFVADSAVDTIRQVIEKEPVSLRLLNPQVPQDLETICLKCLEKQPSRRYQSAEELSDELQRFLSGRPILARPIGNLHRSWRWCQRNPALALSSGTVLLLLLAIVIVAPIVAYSQSQLKRIATENAERAAVEKEVAIEQRSRADSERDKALRQQQIAERQVYASQISAAHGQWQSNQAAAAHEHHDSCRWDLRGWEHDYLNTLMNESVVCRGHRAPIQYVSFNDDGDQIISGARDLTLFNAENGELISAQPMHFSKPCLTITPDGSRVINGNGFTGKVRIVDRESGKDQRLIEDLKGVRAIAVHPHESRLAVVTRVDAKQGKLLLVDLETGVVVRTYDGQGSPLVSSLAFSADGSMLVAGDVSGGLRTWDTETGDAELNISAHTGPINSVAFSSLRGRIYSAGDDNLVQCWDANDGSRKLTLFGHTHRVTCLAVSSDGNLIVSGSEDTTVRTWDTETGKQLSIHRGHLTEVTCVAIDPDGSRLASGSTDTNVRIWSLPAPTNFLQQGEADVICIAVSHDGRRCAQNGDEGTICIYDLQTRKQIRSIAAHENFVRDLAFSPDDRSLASCGGFQGVGAVKIWDVESGSQLLSMDSHRVMPKSVAFSNDGKRLVSGGRNVTARRDQLQGEVKIFDTSDASELLSIELDDNALSAVAFSPDGSQIVTAASEITFWDCESGEPQMVLRHPPLVIGATSADIAFSPDGTRIASASLNSEVQVWDARDGRQLATLRGHLLPVTSVGYSPDGRRLISGSVDRTIKVWDTEFGTELLSLIGHDDIVSALAIDPVGHLLISGSRDKNTRIWDASEPQEFMPFSAPADGATFSTDLAMSVTFGDDTATNVWDTRTGRLNYHLPPAPGRVSAVALHPEKPWIAVAEGPFRGPNSVSLWKLETQQKILTLPEEPNPINAVAINPEANMIAFAGDDGTVKVSRLPSGESMHVFSTNGQPIDCLEFSPVENLLASGSRDGVVQVWDLSLGESVDRFTTVDAAVTSATFDLRAEVLCSGHEDGSIHWFGVASNRNGTMSQKHSGRVSALSLSNDGSRLISGSADRTVRIWDIDSGRQLELLTGHQGTVLAVRFENGETSVISVAQDPVLTTSSLLWRAWSDDPPRCALRRWDLAILEAQD